MCLLLACCKGQSQNGSDYRNKREMMVIQQIEARGISDVRVLNAMRKVERHLFVPPEMAANAYRDYPLPIGWEQTISQPYIVAFMTEALSLRTHSKVLEIGTGSGYQAAILAEICDSVFTVEIIPGLAEKSRKLLSVIGYKNIKVRTGDGYQGWEEHAPYQGIIVTCSPTHVPQPLADQLAEGGKMIIPVGVRNNQELVVLVKKNGALMQKEVLPVRFVPMVNTNQQEY